MNKTRLSGLVLLALGLILFLLFKGDAAGIAAGFLTGLGIGLLVTGQIRAGKY